MQAVIGAGPLLLEGFVVTIGVALGALALATALGVLTAAAKLGGGRVARAAAETYTTLVRGIPDLVIMLLVYFGGQRLMNGLTATLGAGRIEISRCSPGRSRRRRRWG